MSEVETFSAGQVVMLKSGGPKMTVLEIGKKIVASALGGMAKAVVDDNDVQCQWFDFKSKETKKEIFKNFMLTTDTRNAWKDNQ